MVFDKYFKNRLLGTELNWDYIMSIPEFKKLETCEQPPEWHMEGVVINHVKSCINMAYELLSEGYKSLSLHKKRMLLMAVLFHDIGKPSTTFTKDGKIHSYGHEIEGEKIARRLLWDEDVFYREMVCTLIRRHMDAFHLIDKGNPIDNIVRISLETPISYLCFVHTCDMLGSDYENTILGFNQTKDIPLIEDIAEQLGCYENKFGFYKNMNGRKLYYNNYNHYRYDNKPNEDSKQMVIMIGLPGSGKDTYIKKNFYANYMTISRDDIRISLGMCGEDEKYLGSSEEEKKVTDVFNAKLNEYISNGLDIIINNTNLKEKYRTELVKLGHKNGYYVKYIYVEAPSLADNIERRDGQINKDAFEGMVSRFEFPKPSEKYDEFKISKQKYIDGEISTSEINADL